MATVPNSAVGPAGRLLLGIAAGAAGVVLVTAGGCFQPSDTFVNYERSVGVTTGGQGGQGGNPDSSPRTFFENNVKDQLIAHCSGSDCHSSGVRAFLLIGQEYASITTYRTSVGLPLIVEPAANSQLIVYPDDEEHPGKTWEGIEDVRDLTLEWLGMEAGRIVPETNIQIGPVSPMGLTVLPMDALGDDFAGFTISFYAIVYNESVLELTNISIWPPNGRGLKVVDPTWVVSPGGGADDILDSSHHGDHVFVAPAQVGLASGELVLTEWGPNHRLSLRFESLQALFADESGNTFVPCTEPDLFSDGIAALPVNGSLTAPNGLQYCAEQCHGGGAGGDPTETMNLDGLLATPKNELLACAKVREHITPTQPEASRIVTITDPANGIGLHPFIFGGNAGSHAAFRDAMAPWINAEGAE